MKDLTEMKQIKKENDSEHKSPQDPHIVKSKNIHIDSEYVEWIARVKYRYRSAQVKAGARGAVFKDCPILQKPDNKHFAFIRLYFMLFGFVKNCL